MGMTGPFVTTLIEKFKTPHVVAQIGAGGEALFGEDDEVAVDRSAVEAGVGEQRVDLEVGLRAACLLQHRQDSEPRGGAPQLGLPEAGSESLGWNKFSHACLLHLRPTRIKSLPANGCGHRRALPRLT